MWDSCSFFRVFPFRFYFLRIYNKIIQINVDTLKLKGTGYYHVLPTSCVCVSFHFFFFIFKFIFIVGYKTIQYNFASNFHFGFDSSGHRYTFIMIKTISNFIVTVYTIHSCTHVYEMSVENRQAEGLNLIKVHNSLFHLYLFDSLWGTLH